MRKSLSGGYLKYNTGYLLPLQRGSFSKKLFGILCDERYLYKAESQLNHERTPWHTFPLNTHTYIGGRWTWTDLGPCPSELKSHCRVSTLLLFFISLCGYAYISSCDPPTGAAADANATNFKQGSILPQMPWLSKIKKKKKRTANRPGKENVRCFCHLCSGQHAGKQWGPLAALRAAPAAAARWPSGAGGHGAAATWPEHPHHGEGTACRPPGCARAAQAAARQLPLHLP